ncbi:hypothetical protein L6164_027014 [Bauhinia variegata]|uniref:Uncharacterized protein n=1 Tax=Bauhinia variegata TaxID=167791 RepID=A0ACB9LSL9_BAUVA|nr:hypothetical protein L6164_027014 [Bauhinia variegata]
MTKTDIDKLLQFLPISILAFINEGSSFLSEAFMDEPWSWGLTVPISLYVKFALDLHAHLGICVGVGLPSLVYWGVSREPIDWYWDAVLDFNTDFLKTGAFNFISGLVYWLILKLIRHFRDKMKENKLLSNSPVVSKFLEATEAFTEHPLLRPIEGKQFLLKLLEMACVFFYNGNVMLLSWGFSGQNYSSDVGNAISWVSLGSALFVWMKGILKELESPPPLLEQKPCKEEKNQGSDEGVEAIERAICLSEY